MQSQSRSNRAENDDEQSHQVSARRARERELERKRAQGEISCAECRRLKMRCNKKVPCDTCIRRGCHTICPNGKLTGGQGSRFVLANTDKLHSKLLQMSQRIRQLEDALQIAHSSLSRTPHPLLSNELLAIKSGVDALTKEDDEKEEDNEDGEDEELASALGTLTISECGTTRFIGRVASETLLTSEPVFVTDECPQRITDSDSDVEHQIPGSISHAAKGFPLMHAYVPPDELISLVLQHLPTYERATSLVEAFLENVSWMPRPIQRDQIMEELLPMIYKRKYCDPPNARSNEEHGKYDGKTRMHNLALTLAVFACGAAGDMTLTQDNSEGQLYHALALAALNTHPVTSPGGASLETVQTMILIAQYDFFSGTKLSFEGAWKTTSFALVVAASIGLHRDPGHWNLDSKYIQRRRSVFWEIMCFDKFKSLGSGRPPLFRIGEVDCEFPEDTDAFIDSDGKQRDGLIRLRHRFIKDVVGPISEQLCLTRPIKYSEILDFDRRIREYEDPVISPNIMDEGPTSRMKARLLSLMKSLALLTIHRNFFARAIIRYPEDPLKSPFAPSFLCAYTSATKLLRDERMLFEHHPGLMLRLWPVWTHCFTSSIIIGSVASNVKQPALASASFRELEIAIKLFEEASTHLVAKRGLPILRRLHERARVALQEKTDETRVSPAVAVPKAEQSENEELNVLHGSARLLHRANVRSCSPPRRSSSARNSIPHFSSSEVPSVWPTLCPVSTTPSTTNHQTILDGIMASTNIPPITDTTPTSADPAQFPFQPPASSIEQDIASLFDMLYGGSNNDAVRPSSELSGQQQPLQPHQTPFSLSSTSSFALMSNPIQWGPESAEIGSIISSTNNATEAPYAEAVPAVVAADPLYDMAWLTNAGSEHLSGNAAQFVEDWSFLTDPEGDARMLF